MGKASKTRRASCSQLLETAQRQAPDLRMLSRDLVCATSDGWQHRMLEASSMKQPQNTLLGPVPKPLMGCGSNQAPRAELQGLGAARAAFGSWPERPQRWQPSRAVAEPAASLGGCGKSCG